MVQYNNQVTTKKAVMGETEEQKIRKVKFKPVLKFQRAEEFR